MRLQRFLPKRVTSFLRHYNPGRVCCFHLRDFNLGRSKRKQTLIAKKYVLVLRRPPDMQKF